MATALRQSDRQSNMLRVLTYHRVAEDDECTRYYPPLRSASPDGLRAHVAFLAEHYNVVSMNDVYEASLGGAELPPRAVLITFDDAYTDFADLAWPILREHDVPVTLFVPTAYPDNPRLVFWWDRLHRACLSTTQQAVATPLGRQRLSTPKHRTRTCAQLCAYVKTLDHDAGLAFVNQVCSELGEPAAENGVLGWDALRQLAREGVTLGAHTRTHPLMNRMHPDRALREAVESLHDLERQIGHVLPTFAYPGGGYEAEVVSRLRPTAIRLAFTTKRNLNDLRTADPLQLGRIHVGSSTTVPILQAKLLACTRSMRG